MSVHRFLRQSTRARLKKILPMSQWRRLQTFRSGDSTFHRQASIALARRRLKSFRPTLAAEVLPISHRGRAYWAHPVRSFRAEEVFEAHFEMACRVLDVAGIPYTALPPLIHERRIVVVAEEHRKTCVDALTSELKAEAVYGCLLYEEAVGAPHWIGEPKLARTFSGVRVFRFLAAPGGEFLSGSLLGCDIQFWPSATTDAEHDSPTPALLVAPSLGNPWTDVLPAPQTSAPELKALTPSPPPATKPHAFETTSPVDVVYTWVDGSDPRWLERKNAAAEGLEGVSSHPLARNDSRYLSRDELRYSLRSLEMYAGWVRNVYLVTDHQVPDWLRVDHPKLIIVDHTTLFADRGTLPTFNSHAIESQLHHIDGLSETFLYLNDDVFFGAPVTPELFFYSSGTPKFFLSDAMIGFGPPTAVDAPVITAGKNNRALLEKTFGVLITNRLQHVPHALRRSVLAEIEQRYPAEVCRTARSQFRSGSDISMVASLAHYYGYLTGRSIPGTLRYFYADISRPETPLRLDALLRARDADSICLNDVDSVPLDASAVSSTVSAFLESYFPLPSTFEKVAP